MWKLFIFEKRHRRKHKKRSYGYTGNNKTKMKELKKQLKNFEIFEGIRQSSEFNMNTKEALVKSGLSQIDYKFCKDNYTKLKQIYILQEIDRKKNDSPNSWTNSKFSFDGWLRGRLTNYEQVCLDEYKSKIKKRAFDNYLNTITTCISFRIKHLEKNIELDGFHRASALCELEYIIEFAKDYDLFIPLKTETIKALKEK